MTLVEMPRPAGPCTQHELVHHDGSRRTVYCTEREEAFPEGRLIVSRTDLAGVITHANEAFVLMSGYTREELLGAPHHVLRHPDMPRAAFADLWTTLARGQKWHGWVKNLRKDGAFYWVYATVIANVRGGVVTGYTSLRRKPSRTKIEQMARVYADMVAAENAREAQA